jgi:hypothetical protein
VKPLFLSCFVAAVFSTTFAADHPRVYISDSKSWEMKAGVGGTADGFGGAGGGGDRPQTAEIIKTFNERCPLVTVNNNKRQGRLRGFARPRGWEGYLTRQQGCGV